MGSGGMFTDKSGWTGWTTPPSGMPTFGEYGNWTPPSGMFTDRSGPKFGVGMDMDWGGSGPGKWSQAAQLGAKFLGGMGKEQPKKWYPGHSTGTASAGGWNFTNAGNGMGFLTGTSPTPIISHSPVSTGGGGGGPGFGEIASTALTAASLFCDIRLKTDIAPLQESEVNDALADVAFFVKEIRECA